MDDREHSVQYFLDLIKKSHRGKFKVYIGMIAGVGMFKITDKIWMIENKVYSIFWI